MICCVSERRRTGTDPLSPAIAEPKTNGWADPQSGASGSSLGPSVPAFDFRLGSKMNPWPDSDKQVCRRHPRPVTAMALSLHTGPEEVFRTDRHGKNEGLQIGALYGFFLS